MFVDQLRWQKKTGWQDVQPKTSDNNAVQLVLAFGSPDTVSSETPLLNLQKKFPNAEIVGGSTAGNILGTTITDQDMVATAIQFESGYVRVVMADVEDASNLSKETLRLMEDLQEPLLKHILVFSDGINFNGSDLAKGVNNFPSVTVTGGLMGDGAKFEKTYVIAKGSAKSNRIAFIGLYGKKLTVGLGCKAGWGEFGVNRLITSSKENIVYEIDGQPALQLYRKYLGEMSSSLPASGLRFPLSIRRKSSDVSLIRTLLGINEEEQSLIFAGDMPEGSTTFLMKGSDDSLIEGAKNAALEARCNTTKKGFAVLISCVGRKLVMDQLTEEEIEVVQEVLPENTSLIGFYSYGELAPYSKEFSKCHLHNQTMTLAAVHEE